MERKHWVELFHLQGFFLRGGGAVCLGLVVREPSGILREVNKESWDQLRVGHMAHWSDTCPSGSRVRTDAEGGARGRKDYLRVK